MSRIGATFALVLGLFQLCLGKLSFGRLPFPELAHNSDFDPLNFRWSSVKPSKELVYHSCFAKYMCARLLVPLDWQAPESSRYNKTIALAVIKLPAKVPITDPTYAGPVLTNPGGPGGSGVTEVLIAGEFLQYALDSHSKHFDIVSFDPRGVDYSGPDTSCFSDPLQHDLFYLRASELGNLDTGHSTLIQKWARTKVQGEFCANAGIGEYVSTASVARDMLEIVERIEEHREKELSEFESRWGASNAEFQSRISSKSQGDISPPGLQYIGFSYGTFLGNTFASMFPNRVKRMVLDGVVDAPDYVAQGRSTSLQDTDKILPILYKECFEAGTQCPLYNKSGADAIERTVGEFIENLRDHPVALVDKSGIQPPGVFTYSDMKTILFQTLYSPQLFPALAYVIGQMLKGDYTEVLPLLSSENYVHCPLCGDNASYEMPIPNESYIAILCGDGDDRSNQTMAEFKRHMELLESQSSVAGAIWAEIRLGCIGWRVRPKWRFTGPFGGNTSTPILWIGNTADPVTPLRNAYNMAKDYPGSGVLHQDSEGHSALFNAPSECTFDAIRQYFNSGKLPEKGTTCPAARKPFDPKLQIHQEYFDEFSGRVVKVPQWKVPFGHLVK